jgi:Hydrolases of the alpha/beta superfamily
MALLMKIALVLACVYVLLLIGSYFLQRHLTYFPDPLRTLPASLGLIGVEERVIVTPDGDRVIAWWGKARPGMTTLLYFHGNAGSLAARSDRMARYLGRGIGVFMMTYRGYGGSTGKPSERSNVADAKLAYDTLVGAGVAPADIILYGESLGSGIAMQVAVEKEVGGVILDAPYTSLVDVAEVHYPYLPSRIFMTDRYDTMKYLPRLAAPLLIVHGKDDYVVPVEMGLRVHAKAPEPKEIVVLPVAGHSDHPSFGSSEAIYDWIERLRSGRLPRRAAPAQAAE